MSILRDYTNQAHRDVESLPFVQYLLHGEITTSDYGKYLQQMFVVYSNLEYFAEMAQLVQDLPDIKRSNYILQDLQELHFGYPNTKLPATLKYREHLVNLYYTEPKKLMAHIYVRHMGDLYGGKIIAKRVPGSGKAYGFEDRPRLIKLLDAKLSTDLVDEALLGFQLSGNIFNELWEQKNGNV